MSQYILGIDIGSVAVSTALTDTDKNIVKTSYAFHRGDIEKTLEKELSSYNMSEIAGVGVTSSTPETVYKDCVYDNQVALIAAAKKMDNSFDSILFVGGEKFGLLDFDKSGNYKSFKTNTSCAAGTGSFLDQQAGRLNLSGIEELSEIAYTNQSEFPLIASRCAVFAKTDLIHAQQEGYSFKEISDGLCYGLAKNITDTVFSGRKEYEKVVFCGGVSKNKAVKKHIEDLAGIKLYTAQYSHVYPALGVCFLLCDDIATGNVKPQIENHKIFNKNNKTKSLFYNPLELKYSDFPDFSSLESYNFEGKENNGNYVETDIYENLEPGSSVNAWLGIDIGSTSTKAVLTGSQKNVLGGFYTRTAGDPLKAVKSILECIDNLSHEKNTEFLIKGCATTGSGRKFIGKILGADSAVDEITAHAAAAAELNPEVDTIIEIGGQDAKFTTLKNGTVTFSTMNNVCAAGTGSFIEEQAKKLGVSLYDYSGRTEGVSAPLASDRCTVFMERDINHYLAEGYRVDEVLASVLHSVRENYLLKVATESLIGNNIYFQGATAKNRSLVAAFEQRLDKPIHVSKFCHLTGALGASFILIDEFTEETSFRGFDIYKKEIPVTNEICGLCNNNCKITVADINGEKAAYGFMCGRDYDTKKYVNNNRSGFDLLKQRASVQSSNMSNTEKPGEDSPVIGIPYSLHLVEDHYLWKEFFNLLGVKTVSSRNCKDSVKAGKKISETEFCAPASSMFGHCSYLFEKADYIFLPYYLEEKAGHGKSQYCYYTQYIPSLIKKAGEKRVLTPLVNYLYTVFYSKIELYKMFKSIGLKKSFLEISSAYDKALELKNQNLEALQNLYHNEKQSAEDISVILLGRPYTILSDKMNSRVPDIFSTLGVKTFYQDMVPVSDDDKACIGPLISDIHWKYVSKIIQTAEKIAKTDNLYPVYITSFKCSPDSFGLKFFKELMNKHEKPYLILELDEHDSSVGYETRIESAVRAFRNDSSSRKENKSPDYSSLFFESEPSVKGKNLIFPNWDNMTARFLSAALKKENINTYVIEETESTILKSMKFNTGQCIPANSIAQGFVETIEKHGLKPEDSMLWISKANFCNLKLYPNFIQSLMKSYGNGMEKAGIYHGQLTFTDISLRAAVNGYFAHMFGGMLRKMGCKTRPYEINKGETDKVMEESMEIFENAFLGHCSKEDAVKEVVEKFKMIRTKNESRPKAAIFGDIYVRDNAVMNQDLIRFIEENGGEVVTTPYTELGKIIAPMYFKKWFNEGLYFNLITVKFIAANMKMFEKKYMKHFNEIIQEPEHSYDDNPEDILESYGIRKENAGESMENILKVHYLSKYYNDLALFVQANPAFCCPSIVTESMKSVIEEKTSVPVVTITYDGTGGIKNKSIIPYLKFSQKTDDCDILEKDRVS